MQYKRRKDKVRLVLEYNYFRFILTNTNHGLITIEDKVVRIGVPITCVFEMIIEYSDLIFFKTLS